jgi:hypothetical protein
MTEHCTRKVTASHNERKLRRKTVMRKLSMLASWLYLIPETLASR